MSKKPPNRQEAGYKPPQMLHKETQETQETQENQEIELRNKELKGPQLNPRRGGEVFSNSSEWFAKAVNGALGEADKGQGATLVFQFARHLKAAPIVGRLTAKKLLEKIEKEIASVERGNPDISFWVNYLDSTIDDAHVEILDCWEQIRRLPGLAAIENALEFSRRHPLGLSEEHQEAHPSQKYKEFVSLCGWLQVTVGDGVLIAIPCREFANLLSVQPMTISRFRQWAIRDGILKQANKHQFSGPASETNKATEFLFMWSRWPCLRQVMEGKID